MEQVWEIDNAINRTRASIREIEARIQAIQDQQDINSSELENLCQALQYERNRLVELNKDREVVVNEWID